LKKERTVTKDGIDLRAPRTGADLHGGTAWESAGPSAGADERSGVSTRIIVNGRMCVVDGTSASYDAIVKIAFGREHPDCGVAFRQGPPFLREGLLVPGRSVEITDDEVFNVALAVRS
jgi:hypothetical protein